MLRASLGRGYQAIVTRPWPTLPEREPAPGGPSIDTVGPDPHSRCSVVQSAVPGRKPHRIAVTVDTQSAEAVKNTVQNATASERRDERSYSNHKGCMSTAQPHIRSQWGEARIEFDTPIAVLRKLRSSAV